MNNTQKIKDTEKFFNQWRIYQSIIEKNYMLHREMISVYHQLIQQHFQEPFQMLDLGCGDAYPVAKILKNTTINSYTGVDLSLRALESAQTNLAVLDCEKTFINGDMIRSIQGYQNSVDVIITGYSLHHLIQSEKALFFKYCYAALKPNGVYLNYDITALEKEDREQCLHRHWSVYQQWNFDDQDHALVKEHIFEQDFPETQQTLITMAEAQGFKKNKVLYTDGNNIFSAFCFYKC